LKIHPTEELLEGMLLSLEGLYEQTLRHVLTCRDCRARCAYLPRSRGSAGERTVEGPDYGRAFDRGRDAVLDLETGLVQERDEAPGLFVELSDRSAEQREILLQDARFRTWGLTELLVERSLEVSVKDPGYGEELGLLALRAADGLDAGRYGAARIEDLRVRAWAHVANACRIKSDLQGAEEAFRHAWEHLEKGTGDFLEKAVLLDLYASFRRDQRLFDDSFKLLKRAVSIFLHLGERHRAGRSLVKISIIHNQISQPEEAISQLRQALELIDPEEEPRLLLCARHNLTFYLASSGQFQEAQRAYGETRHLYRSFPDAWTQNRRKWVKGKITRGLGQLGQSESLLLAARDGFVAEGISYDMALISLEIALLYAQQGRTEDLKRLVAEMLPVFTSRNIHREALAALAFFQQAVAAERASAALVAKVGEFLRQAQHAPDLRFQEPDE
jgi:tetratricopeptide (TPR) repeat protein